MNKYVLLDIDGCILDVSERIQFLLEGEIEVYHRLWKTDKPIEQGVALYKSMMDCFNLTIVFNTARPESAREYTQAQLHNLFGDRSYDLWMRAPDDFSPSSQLKINNLTRNGVSASDVFMAVDDKTANCEEYAKHGILVCHLMNTPGGED